jgi:ankyrin repeat protein
VNLCDTNGSTPLHVACYNGNIDIVNILLKYNSSVNLCSTNGYTPLHAACMNVNIDTDISKIQDNLSDIKKTV